MKFLSHISIFLTFLIDVALLLSDSLYASPQIVKAENESNWFKPSNCIVTTKKINIRGYKDAFNPSILKIDTGYLLIFRYCHDRKHDAFSCIGIVQLNDSFDVISEPQILETRFWGTLISPHAEDARILKVNDKIYVIYNDNPHVFLPGGNDRRDMYAAELKEVDGKFALGIPIKLRHSVKYREIRWQKNWVPFEWAGTLLLGYSLHPHEVLYAHLTTGLCTPIYKSKASLKWAMGELRGGTPAILVDGEYLAFFHSSIQIASEYSNWNKMLHYFMGAYTFTPNPPFNFTKMSPTPIVCKEFYTNCSYHKRVIFPGGFAVVDPYIYVAYGREDREIWIATLNKRKLFKSMMRLR